MMLLGLDFGWLADPLYIRWLINGTLMTILISVVGMAAAGAVGVAEAEDAGNGGSGAAAGSAWTGRRPAASSQRRRSAWGRNSSRPISG